MRYSYIIFVVPYYFLTDHPSHIPHTAFVSRIASFYHFPFASPTEPLVGCNMDNRDHNYAQENDAAACLDIEQKAINHEYIFGFGSIS